MPPTGIWGTARRMNLTCPNCGARFKIRDDALGTKGRKVKCGKCEHRWHAMPESIAAPAAASAPAAAPADPTEDFAPPPPPPPPVADPTESPPPPPPPAARTAEVEDEAVEDADQAEEAEDDYEEQGITAAMRADPPPIPPESSFEPREAPAESRGGTMRYWVLLLILIVGGASAAFIWRDAVVHQFPAANKVFMMAGFPANTLGYGLKIYEPKTYLDVEGSKRLLGVTGEIMNETGKIIEVPLLKAILIDSKGEGLKSWTFDAKEPRILPGEKVSYETSTDNPPGGATGLRITFTRADEEAMGEMKDGKMMEKSK